MWQKLPVDHPPIKNCINLKVHGDPYTTFVDFEDWELAEGDVLQHFEINIKERDPEDWDFFMSLPNHTRLDSNTILPVAIQKWFNETELSGDWFYSFHYPRRNETGYWFRFNFQYAVDVVTFALNWRGVYE